MRVEGGTRRDEELRGEGMSTLLNLYTSGCDLSRILKKKLVGRDHYKVRCII